MNTKINYKELLKSNRRFADYVERYISTTNKTPEEALQEQIVQNVGYMYATDHRMNSFFSRALGF